MFEYKRTGNDGIDRLYRLTFAYSRDNGQTQCFIGVAQPLLSDSYTDPDWDNYVGDAHCCDIDKKNWQKAFGRKIAFERATSALMDPDIRKTFWDIFLAHCKLPTDGKSGKAKISKKLPADLIRIDTRPPKTAE